MTSGSSFLLRVHLRLGVVACVPLVLDDLEAEVVQRAAHVVELVLGLDDDLVEPLLDRPRFLLLGERAEMPLAAPVAPRAADPGVEDAPAVELHVLAQPVHEIVELRLRPRPCVISCATLKETGTTDPGIVRQRRARQQDEMRAALEPADDLGHGLLPRKLAQELFDLLNLQRALLELVLGDVDTPR